HSRWRRFGLVRPHSTNRLAHSVVGEEDSALSRTGSLLEAQQRVLESIVRGKPLPEVLAALCAIVQAHADTPVRAAILMTDQQSLRLSVGAAPSLPAAYAAEVDALALVHAAAVSGQPQITR